MPKDDFMPNDETGKAALFLHVAATLPTFFTRLSIGPTTTQVMGQAADALAFDYAVRAQRILIAAGQEATAAENRLRDGDPERPALAVNITFSTPPGTVPTAVVPGVVARFRLFVTWLNGLTGFGEDIAQALRITGAVQAGVDLATVKSILPLRLQDAHVFVDWGWGGHGKDLDALEIQVDRGTGHLRPADHRHPPRLPRHRADARRLGHLEIQRHLPQGRWARGAVERCGFDPGGVKGVRRSTSALHAMPTRLTICQRPGTTPGGAILC